MSEKSDKTKDPSRKNKRNKIILVVVILFLALGTYRIVSSRMEDKTDVTSDVVNIKATSAAITTLENTSPLTGRLEPVEEVTIVPKASGEVTSVNIELGQKVSKGAVLFTIDGTQAATAYNQAKVSLSDAQTNLSRIEALYKEGAVSQQQYEQARTAYTMAQESYTAASDGMSNYTVTAPISGYVTSVSVDIGGLASPGAPAATIANVDKLEINTSVSETMINKIKLGDKVGVLVSSVSDIPFTGTVAALSPAPATGSLTYPMRVTLDNASADIKPGMFAEVIVTSDKTTGTIALPSDAILIKSGKTVVATIEGGKKVVFKEVVIGIDNDTLAEIKSGINVGDTVVIEGQNYLEETSKFKIVE